MVTIFLVIHITLAIGIICLVLMQRSEGGGLGIGGSQSGGFMTARGTANALTKLTTLFGALFFLINSKRSSLPPLSKTRTDFINS